MENLPKDVDYIKSLMEHLNVIENIYDLLALCSVYVLKENEKQPYDFLVFNECDYNNISDALEEYCAANRDKGKRKAFAELKKFLMDFFGKKFHKYMGTNLLLVPSYSDSMDLQSGAGELSKDYHCIVVMANACTALRNKSGNRKKERVGFLSLPAKNQTDRAEVIEMYYKDGCRVNCKNGCMGKIISIDFEKARRYPTGISFHVEKSTL